MESGLKGLALGCLVLSSELLVCPHDQPSLFLMGIQQPALILADFKTQLSALCLFIL